MAKLRPRDKAPRPPSGGETVMGWRKATFKDQSVWVEVDADGQPKVDGGRVPIRYQSSDAAKIYRAGAGRVTIDTKAPIENLAGGEAADSGGRSSPGKSKSSKGSGFGKAGTRTAAQAAMAADAAKKKIDAMMGKGVVAFSDGACRGNPGPAGSGAVVILPDGRQWEASAHLGRATNNVAELTAIGLVLDILDAVKLKRDAKVAVFSDSSYANGVLVKNWKAKANQELIAELRDRLAARSNLEIVWIAGHVGVEGNERADALANAGVDGENDCRRV